MGSVNRVPEGFKLNRSRSRKHRGVCFPGTGYLAANNRRLRRHALIEWSPRTSPRVFVEFPSSFAHLALHVGYGSAGPRWGRSSTEEPHILIDLTSALRCTRDGAPRGEGWNARGIQRSEG